MGNDIFKEKAFKHIKRIIGFIDNDNNSPTFGCADRYYWHYKLNDYHNSRFQESALTLSFFYSDNESFLYRNDKLLNLIRRVIKFWIENINKNGSVNEIYPHEQSFCATAFTAYIITETLELLGLKEEIIKYKGQLISVGYWLARNGNWHIANQIAASADALLNLGKLTGNASFVAESDKRVNFLINEFEKQGYFSEYGGFDLGYNTLAMSLLARIYQKTNNSKIKDALSKSNEKLDQLLDEAARYDNSKMSRNTQFIYPFSFKVTQSPILEKIKNGLAQDAILNPDWLDDRYLIGLSNDYLMTYYF